MQVSDLLVDKYKELLYLMKQKLFKNIAFTWIKSVFFTGVNTDFVGLQWQHGFEPLF